MFYHVDNSSLCACPNVGPIVAMSEAIADEFLLLLSARIPIYERLA